MASNSPLLSPLCVSFTPTDIYEFEGRVQFLLVLDIKKQVTTHMKIIRHVRLHGISMKIKSTKNPENTPET